MRSSAFSRFGAVVLAALLAGCAGTYSSLTLAPGEGFTLGGEGDGAFQIELENEGDAPVEVSERRADGSFMKIGTLAPGASQSARFSAGSAAVLTNRSSVEARVSAEIRGGGDLGMRTTSAE